MEEKYNINNTEDLIKIICKARDKYYDMEDMDYLDLEAWNDNEYNYNNYTVSQVDSFGGEGQGDTYYFVYKIVDNDTKEVNYLSFNFYYDSWNGTDFEDVVQVSPKEKIVIEWLNK